VFLVQRKMLVYNLSFTDCKVASDDDCILHITDGSKNVSRER
jgi:hypothetical protein